MKKLIIILSVLVSIGWIFWASFFVETEPDNVIRVARNVGGREGFRRHFELWQDTFERDNPGWRMELVDLGNVNGAEYYKKCIATGDLPDVVMTWQLVKELSGGGYLVPLPEGFYERYGVEIPEKVNGHWFTAQGGMQIQGIAANKRMWSDAGITNAPVTWDAFVGGLRKLRDKGHRPLVFGGREWSAMMPFAYLMALEMYQPSPTPDGTSWTVLRNRGEVKFQTDPVARRIVEKLITFLDEFAEPGAASVGYDEEQRLFYTEKGATWMMGCWLSGGLESVKADFEVVYWPIPSISGRPARFMMTSSMQSGWAVTTHTAPEKLSKAQAVLHAFYDRDCYQAFINGEGQFANAGKIGVTGPKSDWPATQTLYDNMAASLERYGMTPGRHTALDMPDPSWEDAPMRMTQEILSGVRDVDQLLKILDDAWDATMK